MNKRGIKGKIKGVGEKINLSSTYERSSAHTWILSCTLQAEGSAFWSSGSIPGGFGRLCREVKSRRLIQILLNKESMVHKRKTRDSLLMSNPCNQFMNLERLHEDVVLAHRALGKSSV